MFRKILGNKNIKHPLSSSDPWLSRHSDGMTSQNEGLASSMESIKTAVEDCMNVLDADIGEGLQSTECQNVENDANSLSTNSEPLLQETTEIQSTERLRTASEPGSQGARPKVPLPQHNPATAPMISVNDFGGEVESIPKDKEVKVVSNLGVPVDMEVDGTDCVVIHNQPEQPAPKEKMRKKRAPLRRIVLKIVRCDDLATRDTSTRKKSKKNSGFSIQPATRRSSRKAPVCYDEDVVENSGDSAPDDCMAIIYDSTVDSDYKQGKDDDASSNAESDSGISEIIPVQVPKPVKQAASRHIKEKGKQSDSCYTVDQHDDERDDVGSSAGESEPLMDVLDDLHEHVADSDAEMAENTAEKKDEDNQEDDPNTFKHLHQLHDEDIILRCKRKPGIYVKRVLKSEIGVFGKTKKNSRTYGTSYHCCLLCGEMQSNIIKHIRTHTANPGVGKFLELERKKKSKKKTITENQKRLMLHIKEDFRKRGDHEHNMVVRREEKGELLIVKRKQDEGFQKHPFDSTDYVPCPNCYEWGKSKEIGRHQRKCTRSPKIRLTKGEALVQAAVITKYICGQPSPDLLREVYPIMTDDEVTEVAKNDSLIVSLGNLWFRNNIENKLKRKNYTSERMRGAAKFLMECKKVDAGLRDIDQLVHAREFDTATEGALAVGKLTMDDDTDLATPSNAIKIGFDLAKMANMKMCQSIKNGNKAKRDDAADFLLVMKAEWAPKVTRLAHKLLREKRLLKQSELPLPSDLQKLADHIKSLLKDLKLNVKSADAATYRFTVKVVQARLLLYNKRRSGELQAAL